MNKVNSQDISEILKAVGGKENIEHVTHCVTRLRFQLKDTAKVDKQAIERLDIVRGQFYANNQFQVVIGQGTVDKAYKELIDQTGLDLMAGEVTQEVSEEHLSLVQQFIKLLSDVFIPMLPAIVASGLLLGFNNVLTGTGIFAEDSLIVMYPQIAGLAGMISMIAGTAFAFLPVLVSWSVVKRFGGNPLMGVVLGIVLVNPALLNGYVSHSEVPEFWNIFGIQVAQIGYQGQVLPALVAGFCYVQLENWCKRVVPDALQLLLVSTISLLITALLSFIVIGPVTYQLSSFITDGIVGLSNFSPALTGFLFGGCFALLVITGMHHAFLAVNMQLLATTGLTIFWPMQALSDLAQGTAAFVVGFLDRNEKKSEHCLFGRLFGVFRHNRTGNVWC